MKHVSILNGAALAALVIGTPVTLLPIMAGPVAAQPYASDTANTVSVESFRDILAPLGDHVRVEGLGEAWKPRDVADDWQPYSNGRWIFNDNVGWYFQSDEPWAEITYHYGRWYDDPERGWVWLAGTEWAPAWVEWRRSKQHVGWRPLPPDNVPKRVVPGAKSRTAKAAGRRGGAGAEYLEEEWVFVPTERIVEEDIRTVRVERPRVVEIYEETRPIGRVERRGPIAVNFAIQPQVLERESRVRIRTQNLPAAVAAPVPQEVHNIATDQRRATSTTSPPPTGKGSDTSSTATGSSTATPSPERTTTRTIRNLPDQQGAEIRSRPPAEPNGSPWRRSATQRGTDRQGDAATGARAGAPDAARSATAPAEKRPEGAAAGEDGQATDRPGAPREPRPAPARKRRRLGYTWGAGAAVRTGAASPSRGATGGNAGPDASNDQQRRRPAANAEVPVRPDGPSARGRTEGVPGRAKSGQRRGAPNGAEEATGSTERPAVLRRTGGAAPAGHSGGPNGKAEPPRP